MISRSMRRDAGLLLLLAAIPALLAAWLHPRRPEWRLHPPDVAQISLAVASSWPDVLWVDARESRAYADAHVPGAVSLNETEWERRLPDFMAAWHPGQRVVVYCNAGSCDASREVALRLRRELGAENLFVLQGGWGAWQEAHR